MALLCLEHRTAPCREVEWVLIDSMQGGSGVAMDWARLQPPEHLGSRGWMLAGGLHPGNVARVLSHILNCRRPCCDSSRIIHDKPAWRVPAPAHMMGVDLGSHKSRH